MMPVIIAILAGAGLGLLTWYGWGLIEHVRALVERRRAAAESDDQAENETQQ